MSTTEPAVRGFFLTFEGGDGSGKSTQMRMLAGRLRSEGREVLESAEPGGTPIGMQIRRILLDPENAELFPTAELLLMFACRAQNVEQWIVPALAEGKIVVSDRFTDSSLAYQGAGRGLGRDVVLQVDRIACHGVRPDLTVCIDIDLETSLARARARNLRQMSVDESRIDQQAAEFHARARAAYLELARSEPERFVLVDGRADPVTTAARVWDVVRGRVTHLA